MNELTIEWVEKAEGDFATLKRELRARLQPNYDAACFHAQQMVEKYLKAFLQEHGVSFRVRPREVASLSSGERQAKEMPAVTK